MGDPISFMLQSAVMLLFELITMIMIPILVVGLIVGVFQAATQIQEMTLSFIPKIIVLVLVLILFGPLMTQMWVEFATRVIKLVMVV
jgi:flagellar biosynthetic protein FliQ